MTKLAPINIVDLRATLVPSSIWLSHKPCEFKLPSTDCLLIAARLGELYEKIFSSHSQWLCESAYWEDEEEMCESVTRFLERASKLFPIVPECCDLDLEFIQAELEFISITPMGFDIWYDDWDQLHEPAPYLLYMMHGKHLTKESAKQSEFERLYPDYQVPKRLKPSSLTKILGTLDLPQPLNALPQLINMLNGYTGNMWLDFGYIQYMENGSEGYRWDEDVEFLTNEWREAEPIYDDVMTLLNWKNETDEEKNEKRTAVRQALLGAHKIFLNQKQEKETT